MTTFDEAARLALYSDAQLDLLASTASTPPDPAAADPASLLARALGPGGRRDKVTRAMVGDLLTYLPGDLLAKVDLASMAHGLECRGPFLDHRVVELAAAMPMDRKLRLRAGRSKVVLKQAFADLLPQAIGTRRKMGFGVPLGRWFQDELKHELRAVLLDPIAWTGDSSAPNLFVHWSPTTSKAVASTATASGRSSCSSSGSGTMLIGSSSR